MLAFCSFCYDSRACGHYAFAYLQDRVRQRTLLEFVESFRDGDYVWNDHRVGERVYIKGTGPRSNVGAGDLRASGRSDLKGSLPAGGGHVRCFRK